MGLLSSIGGAISKGLDYVSAAFISPSKFIASPSEAAANVATLRKNIEVTTQNVGLSAGASMALKKVVVPVAANTAAAAALVIGAGKVVESGIGILIPESTKGKVIAGGITLVGGGFAVGAPKETAIAVTSLPAGLANVGVNIGDVVSEPTLEGKLEKLKEVFTDNPVIATGVAVGGAVAVGLVVLKIAAFG